LAHRKSYWTVSDDCGYMTLGKKIQGEISTCKIGLGSSSLSCTETKFHNFYPQCNQINLVLELFPLVLWNEQSFLYFMIFTVVLGLFACLGFWLVGLSFVCFWLNFMCSYQRIIWKPSPFYKPPSFSLDICSILTFFPWTVAFTTFLSCNSHVGEGFFAVCVCVSVCVCLCVCICTCAYMYVCILVFVYMCACVYTHPCMCICVCTCVCMCCLYMCLYMCMCYVCVCVCTCMCMWGGLSLLPYYLWLIQFCDNL